MILLMLTHIYFLRPSMCFQYCILLEMITNHISQADLKVVILLPLPCKCWKCKYAPPCLAKIQHVLSPQCQLSQSPQLEISCLSFVLHWKSKQSYNELSVGSRHHNRLWGHSKTFLLFKNTCFLKMEAIYCDHAVPGRSMSLRSCERSGGTHKIWGNLSQSGSQEMQ